MESFYNTYLLHASSVYLTISTRQMFIFLKKTIYREEWISFNPESGVGLNLREMIALHCPVVIYPHRSLENVKSYYK